MRRPRHLRRGIYLLPTLFTVGNLFCGYASLVQVQRGALVPAAWFIVLAAVLDGLDGRIARLTGTTSDFGLEFDSLADVVSFGVAPALLMYRWSLLPVGRVGWLVAFLVVVCAAMRLARFNIRADITDKRHFAGLPSPLAAGTLAAWVLAFPHLAPSTGEAALLAVPVSAVALAMISRFRYRSFKEFDLRNRRSYIYVLPLAIMILAIAVYPRWALLVFTSVYVLSAPSLYLVGLLRRRFGRAPAEAPGAGRGVVDDPV